VLADGAHPVDLTVRGGDRLPIPRETPSVTATSQPVIYEE
jgi:hypothetical protein